MDAPSLSGTRTRSRHDRLAWIALAFLGAVLVLGAWQGLGVLWYGIEGSYDH